MKDYTKKMIALISTITVITGASTALAAPAYASSYTPYGIECRQPDLNEEIAIPLGHYGYWAYVDNEYKYCVVNLNNDVINRVTKKSEALQVVDGFYDNVYLQTKSVLNPNYVRGKTPRNEKYMDIYALSDIKKVSGWDRVNKSTVEDEDIVYTSTELAEFLQEPQDYAKEHNTEYYYMENYTFDPLHPERPRVPQGVCLNKNDALNYGNTVYQNGYCVLCKVIENPNYRYGYNNQYITIYTLSDEVQVEGWQIVADDSISRRETIYSSPEYADYSNGIHPEPKHDGFCPTYKQTK